MSCMRLESIYGQNGMLWKGFHWLNNGKLRDASIELVVTIKKGKVFYSVFTQRGNKNDII